jgi:hypothetical protein
VRREAIARKMKVSGPIFKGSTMVGPTIMALYFCDVGHGTPGESSHLMAHRVNVDREGGGIIFGRHASFVFLFQEHMGLHEEIYIALISIILHVQFYLTFQ